MENKHNCGCGHDHQHDHELEQEEHHCGCGCHDDHDHQHHGDHECGCGHDHHHHDEEYETIRLMLDDDRELECFVLEIFALEDDQEYIALLPKGEENVLIYRFNEDEENEEPQLTNIEDEEEFQRVSDVFLQIMDGGYEEEEGEITE